MGHELRVKRDFGGIGVRFRCDRPSCALAEGQLDVVVVWFGRCAEVELGGLDVFRRNERRLDQQELIDGPAPDRFLLDLDVTLRSKGEPVPGDEQG
jgi:hypothetical protein